MTCQRLRARLLFVDFDAGQLKTLRAKIGDVSHLHMHIADANSPFGAEGVPYVFASFEVQGAVKSLGVLVGGEGWTPQPNAAVDKRRTEIPVENAIVRFQ